MHARWVVVMAVSLVACAKHPPPRATGGGPPAASATFEGLGGHSRRVTTTSPEAQRFFDRGLAFLYAFNHDEAIRSFRKAAELDPKCASAYWGIALANGPHINFPTVPADRATAAHAALKQARALANGASDVERALIAALEKRHADPEPADRKPLDLAYANAMRDVYRAYPNDSDVGALFAEAMMDLRPWDLWKSDGTPQPGTGEILATLESVQLRAPSHPLANHLYIHAVEAGPHPEKGKGAADRLRDLAPALGHLTHMPSHIDVRTGQWEEAIAANTKAIAADDQYAKSAGRQGFYRVYMSHNRHMLTFAAMMTARSELAIKTINDMVQKIPPEWVKENAALADGFVAMPFEVWMRFGKWDAILAAKEPPSELPIARALRHYARGVAYAAKGEIANARAEQKAFVEAKHATPKDAFFGNNSAADLLGIAEHVLSGEIMFLDGHRTEGIVALRTAAAREDKLRYDEPPDWIQPVRHALGAALMRASQPTEAERVYREDLARLPENAWSLHGLARSLRVQKRDAEAAEVEKRLARATANADLELTTSCMCLPGI